MSFVDAVYNPFETARPVSFPEVEKIYKEVVRDRILPAVYMQLDPGEQEFASTGKNRRRAVTQPMYIVLFQRMQNRPEAEVIAELRATAGKVKTVLKSDSCLGGFLVSPGRILETREAESARHGDPGREYLIIFEGKYFEE